MNIYQLFPRLFGNKKSEQVVDGSRQQNGCGTFADIDDVALTALHKMGITHIWLTGIIRHATLSTTLQANNPLVTKGKAGSPYAITDYFDIDADLAVSAEERFSEFDSLVQRIHNHNIKLIIDFVPNHLSREYHATNKPENVSDFGENDDPAQSFNPQNNFYYCVNQEFVVPEKARLSNVQYHEFPAKATGNNVFRPNPDFYDWYDTVKLNYGFDFERHTECFSPIPDTWFKMLQIMEFWCSKHIDGFRVDMAEMVPLAFWQWAIAELRKHYNPILIAEIYQPHLYRNFLEAGFDFLYDKIDLYNSLENIFRNKASAEILSEVWKRQNNIVDNMLRFVENHDEIRLSSKYFVGNSFAALPAVAVSSLMHRGPFMIYNGQESGEAAEQVAGYGGGDGRTSIYDYTVMPEHQKWMNGGAFDGGGFSEKQKDLFSFYSKLLNIRDKNSAFAQGAFYDLGWANPWYSHFDPQFVYAFLRYCLCDRFVVVVNFHQTESRDVQLKIPADALSLMNIECNDSPWLATDILSNTTYAFSAIILPTQGFCLHLRPSQVLILQIKPLHHD